MLLDGLYSVLMKLLDPNGLGILLIKKYEISSFAYFLLRLPGLALIFIVFLKIIKALMPSLRVDKSCLRLFQNGLIDFKVYKSVFLFV